jgi:hypothetical protein
MAENCDKKRTRRTQGTLEQARASVPEQSRILSTDFLIANLELELSLNPIRINELEFSNRKYFAIFRVAFQTYAVPLPASTASPSSIQRLAPSFPNLIETPRLEFLTTPTKQWPNADSNRDKMQVFRRHSRVGSTCNSLCDSVPLWPALTATLTLQAPQSNLLASCFVCALAGEHS